MAIPSLYLLFMLEDARDAFIVVKAIGRQWYWVYSTASDPEPILQERYIIPLSQGKKEIFRLLDTTSPLFLPLNIPTRIFISSRDVLHS
jgi:heme/copper-type cytochrome/quinol oxidase subunit 2